MRARRTATLLLALVAMPATAGAALRQPAPATPAQAPAVETNPCLGGSAALLRCPDFEMKRPYGLRIEWRRGRALLRAGNSLDSVGAGPAELRGTRLLGPWMTARQRIYARAGGFVDLRTGARLRYVPGHGGKRFWKFHEAARFELWRLDELGRRTRRVRRGPKVDYCLRDLERTRPWLRSSPRRRVYPACSTRSLLRRVTLGTSGGWSDVYPPTYRLQWIDVTRLRGCFAYVQVADPRNGVYESDEDDNESQVVVRLPYRRGRQRCPGRSIGTQYREPDHDPY